MENAVKIARAHTGRPGVIAFGGAFHGRTLMGMSLTGKVDPYKKGFGAMVPDIFHVPFPQEVHKISTADAMAGITKLFKADLDPNRVAAKVVELFKDKAELAGIRLAADLEDGIARAHMDEEGIHACLVNLVSKSIKYGTYGGTTDIQYFDLDEQILVEVTDNGPGSDEADLSPHLASRHQVGEILASGSTPWCSWMVSTLRAIRR